MQYSTKELSVIYYNIYIVYKHYIIYKLYILKFNHINNTVRKI